MPTYVPAYIHTYIPTYIHTKSFKPNPTNPTIQTPQTLLYPTHTNNTHMCNENKKRI